jgi:ribosome-binding factor A
MEDSKRQKQVSKLVLEELSGIFQKEGLSIIEGGMISISKVYITPDLLEARIYLSFFQVKDVPQMLHHIRTRTKELRGALGTRVKNQLRRVPELTFFNDDTLDYVDKMEALFKKINEEGKTNTPDTES